MAKKNCAELDKKHFINVNPYGTFEDYKPLVIGPELSKVKTSYVDVDAMFDQFRQNNTLHIALFFHGGLVGECSGMDAAARFHRFYNGQNNLHTVSFVWETGILSSLIEHFKGEITEGVFKAIAEKAAEKIMDKLGLQVPDLPFDLAPLDASKIKAKSLVTTENYTEIKAKASVYATSSLAEIEAELMAELPVHEQNELKIQKMIGSASMSAKGLLPTPMGITYAALKAAARCIYRFARNRNHAVTATILEEVYRQIKIGVSVEKTAVGVWDEMKEQADKMWKSNESRAGDKQYAGRYFLDKLSAYVMEKQTAGQHVKIELVAHSAGSIAICELFDLLRAEKASFAHLRFNNILFMAPAVKCDLFAATIPKMNDRYNRFRMFTMYKTFEQKDELIPGDKMGWVYPMSLLYFVSGLCEDGDKWFDEDVKGDTCILGLEQHIAGNSPYTKYGILQDVHAFLYEGGHYNNKIALVPSNADAPIGYRGRANDHGVFDNDGDHHFDGGPFEGSIRESILHLLMN